MQQEHTFPCPYCGSTISVLVDLSIPSQEYIEDCEVCCRPICITTNTDGEEITSFQAERTEE